MLRVSLGVSLNLLPAIEQHQVEISGLCCRFGVAQLDLFGSAATGHFDPVDSDLGSVLK